MTRSTVRSRPGMTLVELLVVMALIASLAAMVMVVAPGALEKDRVAASVTQIEGALQISRARAMRDGLPRGIRLLWQAGGLSSEYVYTEVAPPFVPNPGGPIGVTPYAANNPPYVQFNYTVQPQPQPGAPPAPGTPAAETVINRTCSIVGLTTEHQNQLAVGMVLYLPTLGTWHRITDLTNLNNVGLDSFPDAKLGVATQYRTYHFGLYSLPQPLLGEAALALPKDTVVDLNLSSPVGTADYDIMFGPSGQLVWTSSTQGAGHVFLWVRNKDNPAPVPGKLTPAPNGTQGTGFEQAGEQLIVVLKGKSGAVGAAPPDWGTDPFVLAKRAVSGQ